MSEASSKSTHYVTYAKNPVLPTQDAVEGIKYDFNDGARILIPNNGKEYHVLLKDADTDTIMYNQVPDPIQDPEQVTLIVAPKKYFVRYSITITRKGETAPIFTHTYNAEGKEVRIQIPVGTLGDAIAWFSYVERFQQKHKCKINCVMLPHITAIFQKQYPDITFTTVEQAEEYRPYANYYIGLFFDNNPAYQPMDFRHVSLHHAAANILGLSYDVTPPRVDLSAPKSRRGKYVAIATQASGQAKYWNNPTGWYDVVRFLRDNGYDVVCIDKHAVYGSGIVYNHIPWGTIDETGEKSLQERIDVIKDADFFIGLGSGLSWLAWCCSVPVVLISGFSAPYSEFPTHYRVHNPHVCHSCWNDSRYDFDSTDFLWCPCHKGTDRMFECTKGITSTQVIETIKRIPTFRPIVKK